MEIKLLYKVIIYMSYLQKYLSTHVSHNEHIIHNITQTIQHYSTGNIRSIVFGGGLAYAWPNGYWHHTPLIILNPYAYASYQIFVSQAQVINWYKQTLKEFR
jgi:hypothetical protein